MIATLVLIVGLVLMAGGMSWAAVRTATVTCTGFGWRRFTPPVTVMVLLGFVLTVGATVAISLAQ